MSAAAFHIGDCVADKAAKRWSITKVTCTNAADGHFDYFAVPINKSGKPSARPGSEKLIATKTEWISLRRVFL